MDTLLVNIVAGVKNYTFIDDGQSILHVLPVFKKGFTVVVAENGKEAIDKISHNHFDATLIDVRLPDMDGTDILSTI
jgi:CheY-like chemotaxis protein